MRYLATVGLLTVMVLGASVAPAKDEKDQGSKPQAAEGRALFDGKSLAGWKETEFGAHGHPSVEDGLLILPAGDPLTGVTREKDDLPHVNYEVSLEAKKLDGTDFFVGLTFPVNDSHASLILGGWGGGVCGISSIDGSDASENPTTSYRKLETGKWYKVRLRVQRDRIEAWLDDEQIVDADIAGKKVGVRIEVSPSKPFGLATYMTKAAYRNIAVRDLSQKESQSQSRDDAGPKGKDPEDNRPGTKSK